MSASEVARESDVEGLERVELLCGHCRYNLRGVPSNRCPECGQEFDPNYTIASLIPWEQRRYIGRMKALVWTIALASFWPRTLATRAQHPVSRSAARGFHLIIAIIAALAVYTLPATALNIWPRMFQSTRRSDSAEQFVFIFNGESFQISAGSLAIGLIIATALTGWFARNPAIPIERQHRALAISHYTCAPLFFLALVLAAMWGVTSLPTQSFMEPAGMALVLAQLVGGLAMVIALAWLLQKRRSDKHKARAPLHPALGFLALALGAISVTLAWIRWPGYTVDFSPLAGGFLGIVGLIVMATPLAWWWIISVRLLALTCEFSRARMIRVAIALPLVWLTTCITVLVTGHAIFIVVSMLLAR